MQLSSTLVVLTLVAIALIAIVIILSYKLKKSKEKLLGLEVEFSAKAEENDKSKSAFIALEAKYKSILDIEAHVAKTHAEADKEIADRKATAEKENNYLIAQQLENKTKLEELNSKYITAHETFKRLEETINLYSENIDVMEYGVYQPTYNFDTSEEYKAKLEYNYLRQKQMIQTDAACYCGTQWTVEGSVREGAKMTKMQKKLMIFAFNGECDALIAKMKWNTATRAIEKINKSYDAVNKLGMPNKTSITYEYLQMKLEELALTHEYLNKVQEEKEEQRTIREQMREEEKAKREFEIAEREAREEEKRYQTALTRVKEDLQYASKNEVDAFTLKIRELEAKLSEATAKKERAISMAQMTKVGHIYIISNIGSFGEDVYKIGMTRRLEPLDRVKELGDASVPFFFDVHAIIYSENAPQMEYDLHKKFHDKRLNKVNGRKEFFRVTLDEIEEYVKHHAGASIEITKLAEAKEYRESLSLFNSLMVENEKQAIQTEPLFPPTLI